MTIEHVIFIPGVLLIGLLIGWTLGARAVRNEVARREKERKE